MKRSLMIFLVGVWAGAGFAQGQSAPAQSAGVTDKEVVEAYHYMLARWLILRQETLDFKDKFRWNEWLHREVQSVTLANPNLDVVYSDAWIYVDDSSCTVIDLPEIKDRYYNVQVLNGWGETTANINERNYPKHPFGKFALCLKGAKVDIPADAERIELPGRKSRVQMRIELGPNPKETVALQNKVTMKATGSPRPPRAAVEMDFTNAKLPGIEGFDQVDAILASDPDINKDMEPQQRKARAVSAAAKDTNLRIRFDDLIRKVAVPAFFQSFDKMGAAGNGWVYSRVLGNYGSDYMLRSVADFAGLWSNTSKEVMYFGAADLDGNLTYLQTFPKTALPASKARYFWSVTAVDNFKFQVVPNALSRYVLNQRSELKVNDDGSLTIAFAPRQPPGFPQSNWMPTPQGRNYTLTYRFYAPAEDVASGKYFPPPLVQAK